MDQPSSAECTHARTKGNVGVSTHILATSLTSSLHVISFIWDTHTLASEGSNSLSIFNNLDWWLISPAASQSPSLQPVLLFQWHSPSNPAHIHSAVTVSSPWRQSDNNHQLEESHSRMRYQTGRPCRAEHRRLCRMNPRWNWENNNNVSKEFQLDVAAGSPSQPNSVSQMNSLN